MKRTYAMLASLFLLSASIVAGVAAQVPEDVQAIVDGAPATVQDLAATAQGVVDEAPTTIAETAYGGAAFSGQFRVPVAVDITTVRQADNIIDVMVSGAFPRADLDLEGAGAWLTLGHGASSSTVDGEGQRQSAVSCSIPSMTADDYELLESADGSMGPVFVMSFDNCGHMGTTTWAHLSISTGNHADGIGSEDEAVQHLYATSPLGASWNVETDPLPGGDPPPGDPGSSDDPTCPPEFPEDPGCPLEAVPTEEEIEQDIAEAHASVNAAAADAGKDADDAVADATAQLADAFCDVPVIGSFFASQLGVECDGAPVPAAVTDTIGAASDAAAGASTTGQDGFTAHIVPVNAANNVLTAEEGHYAFEVTSYLRDAEGDYALETAFDGAGFFLRMDYHTADGESGQTETHYQGTVSEGVWTIMVPVGDLPEQAMLDVFVERYNAEGTDGRSSHHMAAKEMLLAQGADGAVLADALDGLGADGQAKLFTPLFVGSVDAQGIVLGTIGEATDADGDGVLTPVDECPETPAGETANEAGCGPSETDSDGDAVMDDADQCDSTDANSTVDSDGCADNQKDTDGDGITDDLDQCPATAAEATVDDDGCADSQKDTDGDGVTDDLDACSGTADGAAIDANGCSDAQKDTDDDSVSDDVDQCPDTPAGATADSQGCADVEKDTDGDLVMDDADQCPGTTQGAAVDEDGCADAQKDTDADGVSDADDTCPGTGTGAVDANGCTISQRDSDGDDVHDDVDACPDTAAGATVDDRGCAATQRDSDGDGVNDASDTCPATPAGTQVDANGCAVPMADDDSGSGGSDADTDDDADSVDDAAGDNGDDAASDDGDNTDDATDAGPDASDDSTDGSSGEGNGTSDAPIDDVGGDKDTPGFGIVAALLALLGLVLVVRRK